MTKATVKDINEFIRRARATPDAMLNRIANFLEDWLEQKRKAGKAGKGRPRNRPNIKAEADLSPSGRWKRRQKEQKRGENE